MLPHRMYLDRGHPRPRDRVREFGRARAEVIVDTTAYSVCASSGIDPGEYSITSLARLERTHPIATIEQTAALIDRLSRRIEDAVATAALAEGGEVAARRPSPYVGAPPAEPARIPAVARQ